MTNQLGRAIGVSIIGLGLLALVVSAPAGDAPAAAEPAHARDWPSPSGAEDGPRAQASPTADPADSAAEALRAATGDRLPASAQGFEGLLASWSAPARAAARAAADKYGPPDELSSSRAVWNNAGAFRRTVIFREGLMRNFPRPHAEVIEQFVAYQVPASRLADLARFDGSLHADRTAGLLSARGENEADNMIALNLAHAIVSGKLTVAAARAEYARQWALAVSGKRSRYAQGLMFAASASAPADPDLPAPAAAEPTAASSAAAGQ